MTLASTRRCCLWAVVLVALAAPSAWAKPRLAILGIEAIGTVDPASTDIAKDVTAALRTRATEGRSKFSLLGAKRELADERLMSNCQALAMTCMGTIASNLGADYMLYGQLERLPRNGADGYRVTLSLIKITRSVGEPVKNSPFEDWKPSKEMSGSGLDKWVDVVYARLSGEEVEKVEKPPAKMTVRVTNSRRGTVFLNGNEKGRLEDGRYSVTVPADQSYQLAIEADGFQRYEQKVTVTSGQTETVEVELIKEDVTRPPPRKSRALFVWTGAAALAGSAAAWGLFLHDYFGPIGTYHGLINDTDQTNNPYYLNTMKPLESGDCAIDVDHNENVNADSHKKEFKDACRAKSRQLIEGIVGGGLAVLGGGLVLYALLASDAESPRQIGLRVGRHHAIAVVPIVTPQVAGATLGVSW